MKIAFFGTGEFSANILKGLLEYKDIEVDFIVSQEDKGIGRKQELQKTHLKTIAESHDIRVLQPNTLKEDDSIAKFSKDIDFFIVVAYGKIIPQPILDLPKYASINLHASLLPKYRGASPIQASIKNGDKETGITSMYMTAGMDEGEILLTEKVEISPNACTNDIFDTFEQIGPNLLYTTLLGVVDHSISPIGQNHDEATYCQKITKNDGKIDFGKQSSQEIYNLFRAYKKWPGIFCEYKGKKLNIEGCNIFSKDMYESINEENFIVGCVVKLDKKMIGVVCKDRKILIFEKVKLEGKKTLNILDFINGCPDFIGYKFNNV